MTSAGGGRGHGWSHDPVDRFAQRTLQGGAGEGLDQVRGRPKHGDLRARGVDAHDDDLGVGAPAAQPESELEPAGELGLEEEHVGVRRTLPLPPVVTYDIVSETRHDALEQEPDLRRRLTDEDARHATIIVCPGVKTG